MSCMQEGRCRRMTLTFGVAGVDHLVEEEFLLGALLHALLDGA